MKVKMFSTGDYYLEPFEKDISEFIKDKRVHDIKFTANNNGKFVLVMYDDLFAVKGVPVEDAKYILLKEEKTDV